MILTPTSALPWDFFLSSCTQEAFKCSTYILKYTIDLKTTLRVYTFVIPSDVTVIKAGGAFITDIYR